MTEPKVIGGVCLTASTQPAVPIFSATLLNGIERIGGADSSTYRCRFSVGGKEVVTDYATGDLSLACEGDLLLILVHDGGSELTYRQIFPPSDTPKVRKFEYKALTNAERGQKEGKWEAVPLKIQVLRQRGGKYSCVG